MVAPIKKWLLVIDIVKYIYDMQKKGYNHFEADFTEDTRRMEVKAWERKNRSLKRFECETCGKSFGTRSNKRLHQMNLGHGGYAKPIALAPEVSA